jgi:tripartite-type tricarboxylate transporter receptor subunit TctC
MPQGPRLSLKRYFEILMPGLVPGISVFGKVVPVPVVNGVLRACWFAVLACLVVTPASAQDAVADFFRGKQITIYVGSSAGGGYDTYARLISRYFGSHIPGNPTVVVENMPGAGSNKAAGYVYSVAPKDGTAMAAVFPGALLDPLIGDVNVQRDPNKLIYVGNANSDVYICFLRSDAPAKTFQDTFSNEVILGASNAGGTTRDLPAMMNNLLGTKFRVVTGYAGSKEITLAIERNEVNGACGIGWTGLPTMHPDWFSKKLMNVIVQVDIKGHPDLNKIGVPLATQFAKTDEDRQVMELIESQGVFGRPYVMPPGVPPERVAALRNAFVETFKDPALRAEGDKIQLDLDYMSGDDLQALVAKLYALPPNIVARAKQALIYSPPK